MEKFSLKLKKWTIKDIVMNIFVYILNVGIIFLLFIACSYVNELAGGQSISSIVGNSVTLLHFLILLMLMIGIMALYLFFEDRDFLKNAGNSEMLFLIMELGILFCFSYANGKYFSVYLRPFAFTILLVMFLSNRKTAIFMHTIFCVVTFLFDVFTNSVYQFQSDPSEILSFLVMGLTSGIVATFIMFGVYSRLKLLLLSVFVSIPNIICIALSVAQNSSGNLLKHIACGFLSGPLAVALFMLLLPFFETLFKRVSCFRFSELTDHKARLVKRIIKEAPGTFNHSIVLSNIAEACAIAIGEDSLLARTCAYYHDIGKLRRPEFFKENQSNGTNPHDDLTPELSTNIIKAHTEDGYQLLLKSGLPKEVADVCREHHGTMPILYFYDKAKKFTDGEVDIKKYCYDGPKPQTKIAAIIMIADGCEAAARTLKDRSREKVKETVNRIVNDRMQLGQFDECEITLKELNIIIHTVVNNLTGIYHSRIEYPKVNLDNYELTNFNEGI